MRALGVESRLAILCAGLFLSSTAAAQERSSLAIFRDWGAFREGSAGSPTRCFAIAEPPRGTRAAGRGAFVSVASWPEKRIRAQISIHLSHDHRDGAPVTLSIGESSFMLTAQGRSAWAQDRHADARIVSAIRSGSSMSVTSVAPDGTPFADGYRLRGAASAIDSALIACPMRG
jgi:hypothetical protein